jgi:hypothetical protein
MTVNSKRKEYLTKYRKSNLEMFREKSRRYNKKVRIKLIDKLGGKCVRCGFSDWRALQVDHINGGGTEERRFKVGSLTLWLLKDIDDNRDKYQLLCSNCNWIKRYENNENAHVIKEGNI